MPEVSEFECDTPRRYRLVDFAATASACQRRNTGRSGNNYPRGYDSGKFVNHCVRWRGGAFGSGRVGTRTVRRHRAAEPTLLSAGVEAARRAVPAWLAVAVGAEERVDDHRVCRRTRTEAV